MSWHWIKKGGAPGRVLRVSLKYKREGRVVYASVSNNCHENINQQADILQVTGC